MVIFIFSFSNLKCPFWISLVQKFNCQFKAETWYLDYFKYVKFNGGAHLFVLDLFFRVLSKKSIGILVLPD